MVFSLEEKKQYLRALSPKDRKAIEKRESLEQLRVMVRAEMIPIVWALIDKAKDGDVKAAQELFDRAFGKAKEHLEISGKFSLTALAERWQEQKKLKEAQEVLNVPVTIVEPEAPQIDPAPETHV